MADLKEKKVFDSQCIMEKMAEVMKDPQEFEDHIMKEESSIFVSPIYVELYQQVKMTKSTFMAVFYS